MFVLTTAVGRARRLIFVDTVRNATLPEARRISIENLPEDVRSSSPTLTPRFGSAHMGPAIDKIRGMGQPLVIYALIAKRAELSGQVLDLERQKATLEDQLSHIDHALAIFGYAKPPSDIKPNATSSITVTRGTRVPPLMRADTRLLASAQKALPK
jgi:hypothetical protein